MNEQLWLHALSDPLVNLKTSSNLIRFADLDANGDVGLAVCDLNRKLKIFKGTSLQTEVPILDIPTALCVTYIDKAVPRTPCLAVAGGSYVFIYRNMRPYRKWTCPLVPIHDDELSVWSDLKEGVTTSIKAVIQLSDIRLAGVSLSTRSVELLGLQTNEKQEDFVEEWKHEECVQHSIVTCMETLKVDSDAADAMSCLVVGTENGEIFIVPPETSGSQVMATVKLPSVPVLLLASGLLDVEWRVAVICRDGRLYSIKNGDVRFRLNRVVLHA